LGAWGITSAIYNTETEKLERKNKEISIQLNRAKERSSGLESRISHFQDLTKHCNIQQIVNPKGKGGILYIIALSHPGSTTDLTLKDWFLSNPSMYRDIIHTIGIIGRREIEIEGRGELFVMSEGVPSGQLIFKDQERRMNNQYRDLTIPQIREIMFNNPHFTPAEVIEYEFPPFIMLGGVKNEEKKLIEEGQRIRAERERIRKNCLRIIRDRKTNEEVLNAMYERAKIIMTRDVAIDTNRSQIYLENTLKIINRLNAKNGVIVIGQLHLPEIATMYSQMNNNRDRVLVTLAPKSLDSVEELHSSPRGFYDELIHRKTLECMPSYNPPKP
jgi:hypothetical protein